MVDVSSLEFRQEPINRHTTPIAPPSNLRHLLCQRYGDERNGVGSIAKSTIGIFPCKSCIVMLFLQGDRAPGIFQTE